jgi:hypothetical protein
MFRELFRKKVHLVHEKHFVVAQLNIRIMPIQRGELFEDPHEEPIPFGDSAGLAVYLNGTDLPSHVYQECDANVVRSEMHRLLEGIGSVVSEWDGPTETAIYAYGASFKEMSERLAAFLTTYPLCERCRVVQIA